jgi:hypothetical protein
MVTQAMAVDKEHEVITEYYQTEAYRQWYKKGLRLHRSLGREGLPWVFVILEYHDKAEMFKKSQECWILTLLNQERKFSSMAISNLVAAVLPGGKDDIHDVRGDVLAEFLILKTMGVQMHCGKEGKKWVYAYVVGQQADTMEQYKNVSCKSPGGRDSDRPCTDASAPEMTSPGSD